MPSPRQYDYDRRRHSRSFTDNSAHGMRDRSPEARPGPQAERGPRCHPQSDDRRDSEGPRQVRHRPLQDYPASGREHRQERNNHSRHQEQFRLQSSPEERKSTRQRATSPLSDSSRGGSRDRRSYNGEKYHYEQDQQRRRTFSGRMTSERDRGFRDYDDDDDLIPHDNTRRNFGPSRFSQNSDSMGRDTNNTAADSGPRYDSKNGKRPYSDRVGPDLENSRNKSHKHNEVSSRPKSGFYSPQRKSSSNYASRRAEREHSDTEIERRGPSSPQRSADNRRNPAMEHSENRTSRRWHDDRSRSQTPEYGGSFARSTNVHRAYPSRQYNARMTRDNERSPPANVSYRPRSREQSKTRSVNDHRPRNKSREYSSPPLRNSRIQRSRERSFSPDEWTRSRNRDSGEARRDSLQFSARGRASHEGRYPSSRPKVYATAARPRGRSRSLSSSPQRAWQSRRDFSTSLSPRNSELRKPLLDQSELAPESRSGRGFDRGDQDPFRQRTERLPRTNFREQADHRRSNEMAAVRHGVRHEDESRSFASPSRPPRLSSPKTGADKFDNTKEERKVGNGIGVHSNLGSEQDQLPSRAARATSPIGFKLAPKTLQIRRNTRISMDPESSNVSNPNSASKRDHSSDRVRASSKRARVDTSNQNRSPEAGSRSGLAHESAAMDHDDSPKATGMLTTLGPILTDSSLTSNVVPTTDGSVYERIGQVGEGTYGKVYKARHRRTNELVALKRIRMEQERDGFPITSMREIKLLQRLRHPGIVTLLEMMIERGSVYMVFEYMDHDLTGVLANPNVTFAASHIKDLASQLFEGLAHLHHRGVLHRDIKGSNILLNNAGQLKLADFGLARYYQKSQLNADYTNRVITLWFRPPELLLGATAYDAAVDIWSAGCILIELFTKSTIFPGRDEIHQLETIYQILGSPTPETWPTVGQLPWFELIKFKPFEEKFDKTYRDVLSPAALNLGKRILKLDPHQRPLASEILQHEYFTKEEPKPERRTLFDISESHEWDTKQRRRDERAKKLKDERGDTGHS